MSYEEKISEFKNRLRARKAQAIEGRSFGESIDDNITEAHSHGREIAYSIAITDLEEIFGASERSGVGENEQSEEDFFPPFLLCTKFPFCKVQCDTCKEHEPVEKSE